MLVGARDASLRPFVVRGVGARLEPEPGLVSIFLARATSEHVARILEPGSPIAVCFNEPKTHRSIQLKGPVVSIALAEDSHRAWLDDYVTRFAEELDIVGLPTRIVRRLTHWPAYEVRLRPEQVFDQTPGPGAGVSITKDGSHA